VDTGVSEGLHAPIFRVEKALKMKAWVSSKWKPPTRLYSVIT
jgi:hypothetical protein